MVRRSTSSFELQEVAPEQISIRAQEHQDWAELEVRLTTFDGRPAYEQFKLSLLKDEHIHARLLNYVGVRVASCVYSTGQHCSIFDVVNPESREFITCKFDSSFPQPLGVLNALDVLKVLHDSFTQVSLRIIIWHLDKDWRGLGMMDTLSIILGLDFRFFRALFAKIAPWEFPETELRHLYAEHVIVGDYVVAFGNLVIPGGSSFPYLLIASGSGESYWSQRGDTRTGFAARDYDLFLDIRSEPPLVSNDPPERVSSQHSSERTSHKWPKSKHRLLERVNERNRLYTDILRRTLNLSHHRRLEGDSILLSSVFPLFQISSLSAREWMRQMRSEIDNLPTLRTDVSINLRMQTSVLRTWIEATEEDMEHMKRYIRLHQKHIWLKYPAWQMLVEEINQSLAQARRIEAQVRDYLQVQFGSAALEETKKSIELSTSQIQESKRVKIFTVLAFIYVSLNLATSIFGMNLQQLNNNGRPLKVFIITTILALVATCIVWFSLDQFNGLVE